MMLKFLITIFMGMVLIGCSANSSIETPADNRILIIDNCTQSALIEYPRTVSADAPVPIIRFRNLSEYTEFLSSFDLTDEEFSDYLHEKNYYINGLYTKEDAVSLAEKLNRISIPIIDNAESINLMISVDIGLLTMNQLDESGNLYKIRVLLTPDETFLENTLAQMNSINAEQTLSVEDDILFYHLSENNDHVYEGFVQGNCIDFCSNNAEKTTAEEAVSNLIFTTLADLIK